MAEMRHFPEANMTLRAPPGRDDVRDLPSFRHEGGPISCWQLSEKEMEEVRQTGIVWLHVQGPTHPPVYIGGERPFEEKGAG